MRFGSGAEITLLAESTIFVRSVGRMATVLFSKGGGYLDQLTKSWITGKRGGSG
jgi:hypothetical protein